MPIARQLFRLVMLGAINHQITHIVVSGSIFDGFRAFCGRCHQRLGQLVSCDLCFGTWVGLLMALVFRPRFVGPPRAAQATVRNVAAVLADAFAIALAGRFFNEVLAILAGKAAVNMQQQELLERQTERLA